MFRGLLFLFVAAIAACVLAYFLRGDKRYLLWARRLLLSGLGVGVVFSLVLLVKRLI